jgi:hypothetical protein
MAERASQESGSESDYLRIGGDACREHAKRLVQQEKKVAMLTATLERVRTQHQLQACVAID